VSPRKRAAALSAEFLMIAPDFAQVPPDFLGITLDEDASAVILRFPGDRAEAPPRHASP